MAAHPRCGLPAISLLPGTFRMDCLCPTPPGQPLTKRRIHRVFGIEKYVCPITGFEIYLSKIDALGYVHPVLNIAGLLGQHLHLIIQLFLAAVQTAVAWL
jgi:hypothetical protein